MDHQLGKTTPLKLGLKRIEIVNMNNNYWNDVMLCGDVTNCK